MAGEGPILQSIKYQTMAEELESRPDSPAKPSDYEEDATWSWEAEREMQRRSIEDESTPLIADDRQSGAASPLVEPSHIGARLGHD